MSREAGGKGVYFIDLLYLDMFLRLLRRKSKFICVACYEDASIAAMYVHLISGWIFYSSKMQSPSRLRMQQSWIHVELRLAKEDVYVW